MKPDKKFRVEIFLGRIFLVIIVCISTFVIADILSIRFLGTRKSDFEKGFTLKSIRNLNPYIMFKGKPHAKAWRIFYPKKGTIEDRVLNHLGYPEEAPTMPKPADEYRVIVLGGSTVFMGAPSIPLLIQYQFEKKGCMNVKGYNFGVVSSVSSMELARLVFEVLDYDPDLVISYSGFNDIDQHFSGDPRPGYPYNYFIYESNPFVDSDVRQYPLLPLLAFGSNLMRYFQHSYFLNRLTSLEELCTQSGYGTDQWKKEIVSIYINNLRKSQKIANAFNAEFMSFFQPSLFFKKTPHPDEQTYRDPKHKQEISELRSMLLKHAEEAKLKHNLNFIDLSNFYSEEKGRVFKDCVHTHQRYKPKLAFQIYQHILQFVKEKDPEKIKDHLCWGE